MPIWHPASAWSPVPTQQPKPSSLRDQDRDPATRENIALAFGWARQAWLPTRERPEQKHVAERAERVRRQLAPPCAELAGQEAASLTGGSLADSFPRLWAGLNVQA